MTQAHERLVNPQARGDDPERGLRPQTFDDFVGQTRVVTNLQTWIRSAQARGGVLDHVLFTGPPGLGKTTLATLVAGCMDARLITTSGPILERPADLAGMLTKLGHGDVLFIDEIHRLRKHVTEYLYSAMEDFKIEVAIDEGPYARSVTIPLKRFTLIGATTRSGLLAKPFRDRMGIQERLSLYDAAELARIVTRSAGVLGVQIDTPAAALIARRARGTPRLANRYLKRVRDVALAGQTSKVNEAIARQGLDMLGVDEAGLDDMDRKLLALLGESPTAPVGLKTLSAALGEEEDTIENVYEPFLIERGYVRKTARGRILGPLGYDYLGVERASASPVTQNALFS